LVIERLEGGAGMDVIVERPAALDVHKEQGDWG